MKLLAKSIEKSYKGRKVVKGISLEVAQGEIVGLLGPNGAGKTTSFYMIVGLIKPNDGFIYLNDQEITKFPMYQRAQRGIGYLAQEASIFRKLSVEENVLSVLQMTSLSKNTQKEKMESLLEEFGLNHIRKNRGDLLSGGERRRTEIARCLASNPKIILMDEPFQGLDIMSTRDLQETIVNLQTEDNNRCCVISDHAARDLLAISDRAIILANKKIVAQGTPFELINNINAKNLYFGDAFKIN